MFIATIAGYLIATLFAFCGIVNIWHVFADSSTISTASDFVNTLAMAAWPLAVAVVVFMLTQMAGLLQKQNILLSCLSQTPATPIPASKAPQVNKRPIPQHQARDFFNAEEPVTPAAPPKPSVAPPSRVTPAQQPTPENKQEGLNFFRID